MDRWRDRGRAKGPGRVADALLGISGGFAVFFLLDILAVHVQGVNLILFAVWGAAALPGCIGILMRRRYYTEVRISVRNQPVVPPTEEPDNHTLVSQQRRARPVVGAKRKGTYLGRPISAS